MHEIPMHEKYCVSMIRSFPGGNKNCDVLAWNVFHIAKIASYFLKMQLTTSAIVLCLLHMYTTENVSY